MTDQASPAPRPHLVDKESTGVIDWSSGPRRFITLYLPLSLFVIVLLFPFYWMAITAIKPNGELLDYKNNNPFWVKSPTLENINKLLFQTDYPAMAVTTMTVATVATALSLFASVLAAYAIQRLRFKGSNYVGLAILPGLSGAAVDPVHPAGDARFPVRLYDSQLALILTYPTFLIPFCTWLLIGYFKSIPYELEECAMIDGATRLQIALEDHPAAGAAGTDLGRHLRLHSVLERVHLRARLHPVGREEDRAGRGADPARRGRRLSLGLADGRRVARFDPGRDPLFLLRRLLRRLDDGRGEGVAPGGRPSRPPSNQGKSL
jgi:hypothetical protein